MPVTALVYGAVFASAFNEEIDILSDTIKVALATSSYSPSQDADDYFNDVTNEVSGTGYSAGGATLANDTFTYTSGTNTWKYDADDVSWASSTITARYAVVYDSTPGSASTNPLISLLNFGGDFSTSAGTFTIAWHTDGIFSITVA